MDPDALRAVMVRFQTLQEYAATPLDGVQALLEELGVSEEGLEAFAAPARARALEETEAMVRGAMQAALDAGLSVEDLQQQVDQIKEG